MGVVSKYLWTIRGIAVVFQTYVLYPHLSVRDNMSLAMQQNNESEK